MPEGFAVKIQGAPPVTPRTAAEWFALRREPRDAALRAEFEAWLAERPEHRAEYALCELTWELSADAVRGMAIPAAARPRRHHLRIAAAAVVLMVTALVIVSMRVGGDVSVWRTAPGEQRSVTLADGSRVVLNTRSELEAEFRRGERILRLRAGEAFFEVAKDPSRPFTVETSFGTARAVGTRFNVFVADERLEVETEEGRVLVRPATGRDASGVLAGAGTRATLERGASAATLMPTDLSRIQNWRAQRLEFDGAPLRDVLREFSRYTDVPVRAQDADVGEIRVSAVLRPGDLEALRATLGAAFGLAIVSRDGVWVVDRGDHSSQSE